MRWVCAGPVAIHVLGRQGSRPRQLRPCPGCPRRRCLTPLKFSERGQKPPQSEGQQGLQLGIQDWLGLLSLPLCEQIIEEPGEPDQPPAPALLTEPDQQAIAAGGELKATGSVGVSDGHGGRSAGRHLQAGRGQGPATIPRCAASCGTTVSQPRAWLRSLTPPRTMKRPSRQPSQVVNGGMPGGEEPPGRSSEHLHQGLCPEHPLLIGSQDQGFITGHVVRLC